MNKKDKRIVYNNIKRLANVILMNMLNQSSHFFEKETLYVKPQTIVIEVEIEGIIAASAEVGDIVDGGSGW